MLNLVPSESRNQASENQNQNIQKTISEVHLEPCQESTMEFFCENS